MIIVKLQGGLGNQMFQYAFGLAVSSYLNTELCLDTSFYKQSSNRQYELNNFKITANEKQMSIFNTIFKKKVYETNTFIPDLYKKIPNNSVLNGYWQSEDYFKKSENQIRKEFVLKDASGKEYSEWLDQINQVESTSIHIRRGDYLNEKHQKIYSNLPIQYYKKASEEISKDIKNPVFFVFSDDINWAKENLKLPFETKFVSSTKLLAPEEIILMSKCQNNIIANSSFSWWGAWLNQNQKKIVIAPKQWFADPLKRNGDIIPETWQKM